VDSDKPIGNGQKSSSELEAQSMEFPEPTIFASSVTALVNAVLDQDEQHPGLTPRFERERAAGACWSALKPLLAQAWEEGRWSPPGACMNPYGSPPLDQRAKANQLGLPGTRLLRLRYAAQDALAWVENMSPTVKRTALANQLREALGLRRRRHP